MNAADLRTKSNEELERELLELRREQFNLRMQRATGQLAHPHEYGRVKKDIARVKTVMAELKAKS
ncbi:MAG: 50S ribosomal protein L29 [Gammaproteobacteria bacterium]|nr:50S ribosomal protein L29 [Gammaproteobacteria bacterium]